MPELTHFNKKGEAEMVDISTKADTERVAVAEGWVRMQPETLELILSGDAKKGDVLGVARLAGIMAAKKTADLIPLCHPLALAKVAVEFDPMREENAIRVEASVKTTGPTGVEMEALTAISIAALTIYDMVKAVDKGIEITGIRLLIKDGGKSGRFEAGK